MSHFLYATDLEFLPQALQEKVQELSQLEISIIKQMLSEIVMEERVKQKVEDAEVFAIIILR